MQHSAFAPHVRHREGQKGVCQKETHCFLSIILHNAWFNRRGRIAVTRHAGPGSTRLCAGTRNIRRENSEESRKEKHTGKREQREDKVEWERNWERSQKRDEVYR